MSALTLLCIVAAYLLGSINSAVLVCRVFRLPDPRVTGSFNPGATNVHRLGGKLPATLTLVGDILKGTIATWGAYHLDVEPLYIGVVAIAVCLGHMFPLYFQFKGGKGVATAFGALLPIGFSLGGLLILCWLTVVKLTRFSSLGAIVAVGLAPLFTWWIKPIYTVPVMMLAGLIIIRHHANILRLLKGEEPKVGTRIPHS